VLALLGGAVGSDCFEGWVVYEIVAIVAVDEAIVAFDSCINMSASYVHADPVSPTEDMLLVMPVVVGADMRTL
jgi:hypothetical protein